MLDEVFKVIDKQWFINRMTGAGFKRDTILKAIQKGYLSARLAPMAEEITSVPAIFWIHPSIYNIKGKRR